ncbi:MULTISPECIES: BTAD domain-containing putative transcriptional regulator [Rhizobium]|uniref:BTAD domain-containing putative transcriptional regulator n=1 Tax=Rhizobium TaxID=379 RepID=UPI00160A80AD|nr:MULTISPECIES: BTAD domain-containing putative transcriptional regulator [Rhizobium]MBX5154377.1 tetratricopeptide repeat protein [Rhizobium lentis]MBX5178050.1 tetratricopeptide repeat protein [Rhizobium lentis]
MQRTSGQMSTNRLCLLGRPRLLAAGRELPLPEKSYFLFAMLAAEADLELDRETVRRQLWQSEAPEKRAGSLRQLLARIEQSIPAGLPPLLKATRTHIGLAEGWEVDIHILKQKAPLAAEDGDILNGELLEGAKSPTQGAEDWLTFERQRIDELRAAHLTRLVETADDRSDEEQVAFARRLLELDPASETAYRALMRIYVRMNDPAAARQSYLKCKSQLKDEFETEPEESTTALARELGLIPAAQPAAAERPSPAPGAFADLLGQPRIIILPPESIFTDPLMERVGRALLEDVTIGLSQQRGFKVIAAHTSLEILSRSVDPARAVPRALDLSFDYAVYVTIQGREEDVYATCRLTRTTTSEVIWALELPLVMQKISESFAHLTRRIVSSLADTVERHELAMPIGEAPPSAYRLYLEGKRLIAQTDLQHLRQARKWFRSSLNRYENFSAAHAGVSRALGMEWLIRGMQDTELLDEANGAARLAQQSDPNSGRAYRELGFVALYRRRFDESLDYFQQAQDLNPNDADILADYADALCHYGDFDKALDLNNAAFKLNPLPPDYYYWNRGGIHFDRGEYNQAIEALEPVQSKQATARLLAAAHAMAGDMKKAGKYANVVLENFPDFRSEDIRHFVPDRDPRYTETLIHGLQLAGLP